jgi:GTP-binding protein
MTRPLDVIDASFIAATNDLETLPPPAFAEVAFAGRSNVGKSSLLNALLGRKNLARTSSTPGATRGIIVFRIALRDGSHFDLVDLPGYGYAQRSKAERKSWGPLLEGFLQERAGLRGVVVLVDARRGIEDDDRELLAFLANAGLPAVLVATQLDHLATSTRKPAIAARAHDARGRARGASAVTGDGRDVLARVVERLLSARG